MASADTSSSAKLKSRLPTLPPIKIGNNSNSAEETPSNPSRGDEKTRPKKSDRPERQIPERHRFLSEAEWAIFAQGVGGVRDPEGHRPVHPTCWYWPPKGMPEGLYKDIIYHRTKFFYLFHFISTVRCVGLVLQLFIGATLTALGSLSLENGTAITILAAANTINAGILALLHNSGLPERHRSDQAEFDEVEDYLKEILDTGLVPANQTLDQVLADCFDKFSEAKQTVAANVPSTYTPSSVLVDGLRARPPGQVPTRPVNARAYSQASTPRFGSRSETNEKP
jgi:hypothetical protein